MRILIVEDEPEISQNIQKFLALNQINSEVAQTLEDGKFLAESENFSIIILDWSLPDGTGLELCQSLRQKAIKTPIIFLTAKNSLDCRVEGLNSGADDYLAKPFSLEELLARINAVVRRKESNEAGPIWSIGKISINTNKREVIMNDKKVELSPKEYSLLELLARNKDKVVDRMAILEHVWGESIDPLSNTVDVHVRYLRKKLNDDHGKIIQTVKGKGYLLCES